jgi:hypothetical protein
MINLKTGLNITSVMKKLAIFLMTFASIACVGAAPAKPQAFIPESVSHVEMAVVGSHIVRVIQHNMELNPVIQFEVMARPDFKVIDSLMVTSIPFKGDTLSFKESSGAFVEGVKFIENGVEVEFEYFYLRGGSVMLRCMLPVEGGEFRQLECAGKGSR